MPDGTSGGAERTEIEDEDEDDDEDEDEEGTGRTVMDTHATEPIL